MVKLFTLILSIYLAYITNDSLKEVSSTTYCLRFIGLFIIYIIAVVLVFFLSAFLLSLPIRKSDKEKYSKFYRFVLRVYTKMCLSLFGVEINASGIEKLPKDEKFVLVSNHLSNLDSMVIDVYLKDYPLVFVAKKSLFKIPFFGKIIQGVGYLSLDRENIRQELKVIKKGISMLENEETSICVFPEGTRNFTNDTLLEFKPGCFNLATKSKKTLVVSYILGTNDVKNGLLYKKHNVTFKIVKVIPYEEIKDMNTFEVSELVRKIILENIESELKDLTDLKLEEV